MRKLKGVSMLTDAPPQYAPRHAVGLLLESFVRTYRYVPDQAHSITDPEDLPNSLRHLTQLHSPLSTWRAWMDEPRLWFVIGRLSEEHRQSHDSLLLEMLFLSVDGRPVAAGCWGLSPQGRWVLRRIDEPETAGIAAPQSLVWGAKLGLTRRNSVQALAR